MTYDKNKLANVLHYIISEIGGKSNVGKTVLYKLLYFADFDYYEHYEEKLTGEQYRKIDNGPAPSHFDKIIEQLEKKGKIVEEKIDRPGFTRFRYLSFKKPDLNNLTAREIKVIDGVIQRLGGMNANKISEYSHSDIPWKATKEKDIIDYELVFYRDAAYSVREDEGGNSD